MIPAELSVAYATLAHDISALKGRVDPILKAFAEEQDGLYSSRVKSVDSVYEKVVLGHYKQLGDIEDLLAATIVLPSAPVGSKRHVFSESLKGHFNVIETRSNRTRMPSQFIYDDLHYILTLKDSPLLLNKRLLNFPFELQVKSYLQHGWAKAMHNTVYKSPTESWRANRVAAQTKAAVEMVEAALVAGEGLLPEEAEQQYDPIDNRVYVCGLLLEWWSGDFPENRRRLGMFTLNLLQYVGSNLREFKDLLDTPRARDLKGKKSLSIQQAILILLIENYSTRLIEKLRVHRDCFLLITSEMADLSEACRSIPDDLRISFVQS